MPLLSNYDGQPLKNDWAQLIFFFFCKKSCSEGNVAENRQVLKVIVEFAPGAHTEEKRMYVVLLCKELVLVPSA